MAKFQSEDQQLLVLDIKNKFSWAIMARYFLIAIGAFLIYIANISGAYLPLSLNLILFVAFYNLIAQAICYFKEQYQLWEIITIGFIFEVLDIAAITFIIYITGWVESPYWFLYFVLIIISGFGMFSCFSFSVFFIAFFSALFYLGLLWAAYLGLLPIYGAGLALSPQQILQMISNKAVFTTVSFLLFSLSIYYFSRLLNQQRAELSEKNFQLLESMEKVKDIDRVKDEFVSTASHDLRTPLSVVRENVSLIEDGIVGEVNPKQKQLLKISRSNIDHLSSILDNLLDISKIESRSLELHREMADIGQVAAKAVELLKSKAEQKNLNIETKLQQNVMTSFDLNQILRVYVNLINNAIKYTAKNGRIEVGLEADGKTVNSYVRDNGIGIEKADQARVFDRFVRIDGKETTKRGAGGLGLSICKGIIEMHGGKIWVESEVGKGSKFIFELPKIKINA